MDRQYAIFMALGFELVGLVTVLLLLGQWLDKNQGWGGYGQIAGAIIGTVGWFVHLVFALKQLAKREEESEKPKNQ